MVYVKIAEDGSIEKFPYMLSPMEQEVPENVFPVDTESHKPTTPWYRVLSYLDVKQGDEGYYVTYMMNDRYSSFEEKQKGIETLKRQHEGTNERTFITKAKALKEKYTDLESESWPIQRAEAVAYSADETVATPLLQAIADARGITLAEQVSKVLENVAAYDAAYGSLLGRYQKNKTVLNTIDLTDESTWDLIDTIERL